jgi:predicted methyltransferase
MSLRPKLSLALGLFALTAVVAVPFQATAQDILADPVRTDDERARDAGSKPLEVYAFWGIEPGMTVVDLMPGGGYNTVLLSKVVGDAGHVYAGPPRGDALANRLAAASLSNVHVIAGPGEIEAGSADAMITVRNMHDLGDRAAGFLAECHAGLKAGGILGVVDARTNKDGYDSETHRINQQMVIDLVTAAGFELVDTSEMLANPDDDFGTWEGAAGRTSTDRMVLKFRKS